MLTITFCTRNGFVGSNAFLEYGYFMPHKDGDDLGIIFRS